MTGEVVLRGNNVQAIRPETVLQTGDKVLAVARAECENDLRRQLIGDGEPVAGAAGR